MRGKLHHKGGGTAKAESLRQSFRIRSEWVKTPNGVIGKRTAHVHLSDLHCTRCAVTCLNVWDLPVESLFTHKNTPQGFSCSALRYTWKRTIRLLRLQVSHVGNRFDDEGKVKRLVSFSVYGPSGEVNAFILKFTNPLQDTPLIQAVDYSEATVPYGINTLAIAKREHIPSGNLPYTPDEFVWESNHEPIRSQTWEHTGLGFPTLTQSTINPDFEQAEHDRTPKAGD